MVRGHLSDWQKEYTISFNDRRMFLGRSRYFICVLFLIGMRQFFVAQELVQVEIFSSFKMHTVKLFFQNNYSVQYDEMASLCPVYKQQFYQITVVDDSLVLLDDGHGQTIRSKKISFYSPDIFKAQFSVVGLNGKKDRVYKGHLMIRAVQGYLKMINALDLDDYVCGVIEAEVGKGRHPEFYKAQALLVRTYALSHLYKHSSEGYNLCDQVHCQVYNGVCQESLIAGAVERTHDLVIVDKDLNLIVAAFHSNSGGQTVNSEDIWGSKKEYLRSVKDTFSLGMPSFYWKKKLSVNEWMNYLKKYRYPVSDSEALQCALNFKQETRHRYLQYKDIKIPLKSIRDDFKLMSTFFDIQLNASRDSVIFSGRGFGHGVGLSQEGAMRMAKLGFNYKQIISFYYQNVLLIDLKKLNFFREE